MGLALAAAGAAPREVAASGAVVWRVQTSVPDVALTFDDGPSPEYTPQVLAELRAAGAVATFFVLGSQVQRHPDLVRAEAAEHSQVCNHGWRHVIFRGLSAAEAQASVTRTAALLQSIGVPACRLFRFPYFASDATARAAVEGLGFRMVAASVDPRDWQRSRAEVIARIVLADVSPGEIVVLHDGGGSRGATVGALALILRGLGERGLRPVTVGALLAEGGCAQPPAPCPPDSAS